MASPIEDLFEAIFGFRPKKEGEAYEKLAAAVVKILGKHDSVFHDKNIRGLLSKTIYQIDVLPKKGEKAEFGEAKDYTERMDKVGRPDLQKLGGALLDLPVEGGLFFSATDYTRPARKYADAAQAMFGKGIDLFHLRPSTEQDEEGRVKTIVIELELRTPEYEKAKFEPVWTADGDMKLKAINKDTLPDGKYRLAIAEVYDAGGKVIQTIAELLGPGVRPTGENVAEGMLPTPGGHLKVAGELIAAEGIRYQVPFVVERREIHITADGKAVLFFKDDKGEVEKVITDEELKKVTFKGDGEVDV